MIADSQPGLIFSRDDLSDWVAALHSFSDGKNADTVRAINLRIDQIESLLDTDLPDWTILDLELAIRSIK